LGGHVRKGEHGTRVYFVKQLQAKDDDDEKTRIIPMLREYTVFNVDQCEGLPARVMTAGTVKWRNPDQRDATIDEFLSCSGADIREGHGEAYFVPSKDFISMPAFAAFKSAAHFYGVTFHELGHWTGHKSRLDRDLKGRFGERAYAAEELVAELIAAFLCAEFSIDGDLRHAGYIATMIARARLWTNCRRKPIISSTKIARNSTSWRTYGCTKPTCAAICPTTWNKPGGIFGLPATAMAPDIGTAGLASPATS
jgi:antirestriction protein ArdC